MFHKEDIYNTLLVLSLFFLLFLASHSDALAANMQLALLKYAPRSQDSDTRRSNTFKAPPLVALYILNVFFCPYSDYFSSFFTYSCRCAENFPVLTIVPSLSATTIPTYCMQSF